MGIFFLTFLLHKGKKILLGIPSLHGDEITFTPRKRVKQINTFPQILRATWR